MQESRQKKPLEPLPDDAVALLPLAGESFRCATFTATLGIDPVGTAISADLVIVVDTPLPWPKPVFDHDALAGVEGKATTAGGGPARILASVPADDICHVRAFARSEDGTVRAIAIPVGDAPGDRAAVVADLLDAEDPMSVPGGRPGPDAAVLVCTQGSHDICCGSDGTALVADLEHDARFDGVAILKVSHTGGHRFAPTAMTFPDGRMWAYAGPDLLSSALWKDHDPAAVAPWCRGWWGAPDPECQVAERAVFARGDWADCDQPTRFEHLDDGLVRVTRGRTATVVEVAVKRHVPVVRCRAEGGLPAKPSAEYSARIR